MYSFEFISSERNLTSYFVFENTSSYLDNVFFKTKYFYFFYLINSIWNYKVYISIYSTYFPAKTLHDALHRIYSVSGKCIYLNTNNTFHFDFPQNIHWTQTVFPTFCVRNLWPFFSSLNTTIYIYIYISHQPAIMTLYARHNVMPVQNMLLVLWAQGDETSFIFKLWQMPAFIQPFSHP